MKILETENTKTTVIEIGEDDSALIFTKKEDGTSNVMLFIPEITNIADCEISDIHLYCLACAALSDNSEFVNYAVSKFIEFKKSTLEKSEQL